jgi:hypothetical protein
MTIGNAKDWAAIVGTAIALATLAKGVFEYGLQGAQKRAEQFMTMQKRFRDNPAFRELSSLIETDAIALQTVAFKDKRDFLAFFEEIALMMNTGIIRESVAHYMFGYYAIRCWESGHFWEGVPNKDSPYWSLFRDFVERMKQRERDFRYVPRAMRF